MPVVVVGASGSVGRQLVAHWARMGAPVALQWRRAPLAGNPLPALPWNPDDGPGALAAWCAQAGPVRAMLVLAGATPRTGGDLAGNAAAADACLAAAQALGIPRVLVASSSAVYGDHLPRPYAEGDTPRPVSDYGRAKLAAEGVCARWRAAGVEVTALRIGNVAGADSLLAPRPGAHPDAPLVIDRYPDGGSPRRSYIGPGTLARVLTDLCALPRPLPAVLNIGAPAPVEMADLARAAGRAWVARPRADMAGRSITLDCGRLWGLVPAPADASDPAAMARQVLVPGAAA